MKVLHLSTWDTSGGAARGAYWLHKALQRCGVDSRMLVSCKCSRDESVVPVFPLPRLLAKFLLAARHRFDCSPLLLYPGRERTGWTVGRVPGGVIRAVRAITPDVVHLHWVGGFLSVSEIAALTRWPLVWTMRDMGPFTGGCRYSAGCKRFKDRCGRCPLLGSGNEDDLSRRTLDRKARAWANKSMTLVGISNWLAGEAMSSLVFQNRQVQVIHNGVDVNMFRPLEKLAARKEWGLGASEQIILYGAPGADDKRKGMSFLREALQKVARNGELHGDIRLVVFGDAETKGRDLSVPTRYVGYIGDDEKLASLYSAADVMVVPSVEEAFGKTAAEAMACGTPVVAFQDTGVADIVEHGVCGFVAPLHSAEALGDGILWVLGAGREGIDLRRAARQRALDRFDIRDVARRYVDSIYGRVTRTDGCPKSPAGVRSASRDGCVE